MNIHASVIFCAAIAFAQCEDSNGSRWRDDTFTTSDGVRLHYVAEGRGKTIVFVPGWTMPAEIWQFQLRYFAATHRVVALDPRSQGQSEKTSEGIFIERRAKDIGELLQHLGDSEAILVGWSMACREILQLVDQSGTSRIAGIVLVDDYLWTKPDLDRTSIYEHILERLLRDRRAFTDGFVRNMFRTPQTADYLARIGECSFGTPTPIAYTLVGDAYASGRDFRSVIVRIDRPLLYVGTYRTKDDAEYIRAAMHDSQVEIFELAGHALFVDEPERFNALLDTFVQRVEGAQKQGPNQSPEPTATSVTPPAAQESRQP